MSTFALYLLLLKATITSFSGLTSLPVVRHDFVVERHLLTDRQLNTAVAAGRISPGANGLYLVSVGYMVGGFPGACAGWCAIITPAFLIIGLLRLFSAAANHPAMERTVRAVTLSAAGLILATSVTVAKDALNSAFTMGIAVVSLILLVRFKIDPLLIMLGAAILGLANAML